MSEGYIYGLALVGTYAIGAYFSWPEWVQGLFGLFNLLVISFYQSRKRAR